jgi:rare lipoprotein A (peptidoglycan hydrolase)
MATRILMTFLIFLAFTGYVSSDDKESTQEAQKIAEKVKRKAERSEKAEGRQDLVKDKVTVKQDDDGQPIVEQFGEASFYGARFNGKKTATGEKFDQNEKTAPQGHPQGQVLQ